MNIRTKVRDFLSGAGYEVVSASSIDEAGRLFKTNKFDLVLSDSDLPNRFEGLHFVLSILEDYPSQRVAILAEKHQFRKIPFIGKGSLVNSRSFINKCQEILLGTKPITKRLCKS